MKNLLKNFLKGKPQIKSETLAKIYKKYESLNLDSEGSYTNLIEEIKKDFLLKSFLEKSQSSSILETKIGICVNYESEAHTFYIIDASCSGFPDYLKAQAYPFDNENFKKIYGSFCTPEKFKQSILSYLIRADKILNGEMSEAKQFNRNNLFKKLYEESVKICKLKGN
jgi:hypothetical protein